MIFYCPKCWKEINEFDGTCRHCNADILIYENMDYEKKLLNALRHTEPETVLRAVNILGRLKSEKAAEPLIALFKKTDSTFLKIAILKALNEIGISVAREFVKNRSDLETGIVRRTAKELIDLRVKLNG
ncbi:MAG: HEAT repeat domain-containing protein [Candidatus Kuenenia sp.]|nr:HEAT repeat domain-containing protein [Candidatus Kuenenia hertensis]